MPNAIRCGAVGCLDCGATFCHRDAVATIVRTFPDDEGFRTSTYDLCQDHLDRDVARLEAEPALRGDWRVDVLETS